MKVGRREVVQSLGRIAVLAVPKILLHDQREPGVLQEVSREAIQR